MAVASPHFTIEAAFAPDNDKLARIGFDNALTRGSFTATDEEAQRPASNLLIRDTYQTWRPAAVEAVLNMVFTAEETIDYIAIARHDMGSKGITATVELKTDAGSYTLAATLHPQDDRAILVPIKASPADNARVTFDAGGIPTLAVLQIGKAVVMERPLRATMQPVYLSRETDVTPQMSGTGELLSSIVIRRGFGVSPKWRNLSRSFYNGTLQDLARDLPGRGVFLLWQPEEHPDETLYGVVTGDVDGGHISRSSRYEFGFALQAVA